MRIKIVSYMMLLSIIVLSTLFFIEKTNFAIEPSWRQRKKAWARVRAFQKRYAPPDVRVSRKKAPPAAPKPEIQQLLTAVKAPSVAQAINKIKGLDELLEELEAETAQQGLKNFERGMERIEKIFEAIAIAIDLDIEFEEEEPIQAANKIIEAIYALKSRHREMAEMSPMLAQYISTLEGILTEIINAKGSQDWDKIWYAIPDQMPVNPLVEK